MICLLYKALRWIFEVRRGPRATSNTHCEILDIWRTDQSQLEGRGDLTSDESISPRPSDCQGLHVEVKLVTISNLGPVWRVLQ